VIASPILLLAALLGLFGFGRFTYCLGRAAFHKSEEVRSERLRIGRLAGAARVLLEEGRAAEAQALLRRAEKAGTIQFYVLRREDKVVTAGGNAAAGTLTTKVDSRVEAGPFTLALGVRWSWPARLRAVAVEVAEELLFLALAGAALLLTGAGVRRLRRRPRNANSVRILRELRPDRPALRRTEAKVPPAESEAFECTLLRMRAGAAIPESALAEILDLAGRYGGELAGGGGPELICFFRDGGDGHSAITALGAARDLRECFQPQKIGARYALAHGFARLVPDGAGAERKLVGAPFLEVGRLTAEPGQIVVTERVAKFAVPAAKFKTREGLVVYGGHAPIADVLERARRSRVFAELDGFHADPHLAEILATLRGAETEFFLGVGQQLRRFSYQRCSAEARESFKAVLREELRRQETFRLSSLIALAPCFFARETVDEETYALFLEALASPDRRVKSNTIELFIALYPNDEVAELKSYAKSGDHRISANVLIKQALERLDERIVRTLYGRVRGGSVAHVASAFFAIGEIAERYGARDPAALKAKASFLRLFAEIPFWVKHPNPMVRRQALGAARKLGNPELDQKLRAIFDETGDQELLALFANIYQWRKGEKQSSARRTG
jgi:hypothetical protein